MITLTVNGSPQQLDARISLAQLLENMQLSGKRVAVERNGEIVPRSQYAQVKLQDGDQLEIVVAVGGG
ncbi:MAG: thiamine biosynthesis protein ThiS [Betaproteobacteria bacterium RBG_16_58_11]|nr:MAG: thiamine biosynthesis protein ThiS [Betaproteobacteria bacterium RBG_16_58_11]